jgi:hypothetical protein
MAPINTSSAEAGTVQVLPVFVSFRVRASSLPVPSAAAIWVVVQTSILVVAPISSISG